MQSSDKVTFRRLTVIVFAVLVPRAGIAALNPGHGVMPLKSESGRLPRILREIYYSENQGSNNVL